MDDNRETAAHTLPEARHVPADLIRAEADRGRTPKLAPTRRTLEFEIHTLETALRDWDDHIGGLDR